MIKVSAALILRSSEILVCQRKKTSRYPLQWEFPGGKLESGETPEQCLYRELTEELSIDAEIGTLFYRHEWHYPDSGTFEVYFFLVSSFHGEVKNNAFEQIRWIPMQQLPEIDMLEGNREVVQKIMKEFRITRGDE
jgi:8-oxo-dGTP diphosphatase